MTNKEIEKLVKIYFEDLISIGYVLFNDILIKVSKDNIIYGFCFEKSSNKNELYIWSFCLPLYMKKDCLTLTFGKRLGKSWLVKENDCIDTDMKQLLLLINYEIENYFPQVNTAIRFYDYFKNNDNNFRVYEALVYSAIYSKRYNSSLILNNFIDELENDELKIEWINNLLLDMKYLSLILNNEIELENFFNKNIINTKKVLKLIR